MASQLGLFRSLRSLRSVDNGHALSVLQKHGKNRQDVVRSDTVLTLALDVAKEVDIATPPAGAQTVIVDFNAVTLAPCIRDSIQAQLATELVKKGYADLPHSLETMCGGMAKSLAEQMSASYLAEGQWSRRYTLVSEGLIRLDSALTCPDLR